jgi:1,2-beta-oligoglucan phosphorylase
MAPHETLWAHCDRVLAQCQARFLRGTALVDYEDGDRGDTLQPADPAMRTRMVSAWTVALAYQTFRQLSEICRRAGEDARARRLDAVLERMRADFHEYLYPEGRRPASWCTRTTARGGRCSIRRTRRPAAGTVRCP